MGLTKSGEDRTELRHWKDLKIAHMRPEATEAERPKRGRPPKSPVENVQVSSEADSRKEEKVNNATGAEKKSTPQIEAGNSNSHES